MMFTHEFVLLFAHVYGLTRVCVLVEEVVDKVLARAQEPTLSPEAQLYLSDLSFRKSSGIADLPSISHRRTGSTRTPNASTRGSRGSSDSALITSLPLLDESCELTIPHLAQLNRSLMKAQAALREAVRAHESLVDEIAHYEELGDLVAPVRTSPGGDVGIAERGYAVISFWELWVRYFYRKYLREGSLRVLAVIFGGLSLMVLWSEICMGLPVDLSPFGSVMEGLEGSNGLQEMVSLIPLVYMSHCVYSSLFKIRLFGRQGLKKKQSGGVNLCFSASYLVRMQVRDGRAWRVARKLSEPPPSPFAHSTSLVPAVLQLPAHAPVLWQREHCVHESDAGHGHHPRRRHYIQHVRASDLCPAVRRDSV